MIRFPCIGINTTTYTLAAGHDGSEKSIIEATDAHLDLLRTEKPVDLSFLGVEPGLTGRPLRFLQSGLGFETDAWHDPAIDVIVARRCIERGYPVLWTLFNDNPDVPGATPKMSGVERQKLVAREIIAARSIIEYSDWFCPTVHREGERFAGLQMKFETVNADLVFGRMLTQADAGITIGGLGREFDAEYGGFAYDYREGDCKLRRSRWNPRLISEFGVDWTPNSSDGTNRPDLPERLIHLIGLMKGAGVRQAYLHEATSRGYRYDPAVWNAMDGIDAPLTGDAVKFGWFSLGHSTWDLWMLDRLWNWGVA